MSESESVNVDLLSLRQETIWRFVARYVDQYGYAPSIREIAQGVGLGSVNSVWHHLRQLEKFGVLLRAPGRARSIVLLEWPEVM